MLRAGWRSLFSKSRTLVQEQFCSYNRHAYSLNVCRSYSTVPQESEKSSAKTTKSNEPNWEEINKVKQVDLMGLLNTNGLDEGKKIPLRAVKDRLEAIKAYIETGQMLDAEFLFHRLHRSNRLDMQKLLGADIFNAFIQGYLQASESHEAPKLQLNRALEWFHKITLMGYKPSKETFTLFLYYYCKKNMLEQAVKFLELTRDYPQIDLGVILGDDRFTYDPEAKATFELVMKSKDLHVQPVNPTDALLLSVIAENEEKEQLEESFSNNNNVLAPRMQPEAPSSAPQWDLDRLQRELSVKPEEMDVEPSDFVAMSKKSNDTSKAVEDFENLLKTDSPGVKLMARALRRLVETHSNNERLKYVQQAWLEEESWRIAIEEKNNQNLPESMRQMASMPQKLLQKWFSQVLPLLKEEVSKPSNQSILNEVHLPFLKLVKPEQMVILALTEILRVPTKMELELRSSTFGDLKVGELLIKIGDSLECESNLKLLKERRTISSERFDYKIHSIFSRGGLFEPGARNWVKKLLHKEQEGSKDKIWSINWPMEAKMKISAMIVSIIIKNATITIKHPEDVYQDQVGERETEEPAFSRVLDTVKDMRIGKIKLHPKLIEELVCGMDSQMVSPKLLPMIVPPRPWLSYDCGGYLRHGNGNDVVRCHHNPLQKDLVRMADSKQFLSSIFHALDVLGSTPWRIDERVLEVAKHCWNEGKEYPGIPSVSCIPEVEKPNNLEKEEDIRAYKRAVRQRQNDETSRYSQRCDTNYKIMIASSFAKETIYFPQYVDFRGRAYPLPSHFNHIGNDLCRGLLRFANGKPLGENGLKWLKVQIANVYGNDKLPFEERIQFTEKHLDDILDSAKNPIEGKRWWLSAEEPWQCLAACHELSDALKLPDPTQFVSTLPIHQDGTCNGLQHYAALGGDLSGAKLVNLIPADRPSDVYTGIAEKVAEKVERDAQLNVPEAILMKGKVTRKIVKQTVMTNTYGVTMAGARAQVRNRIQDIQKENNFTEPQVFRISNYIAKLIFESFGNLFTVAQANQEWLNKAARTIACSVSAEDLNPALTGDAEAMKHLGITFDSYKIPQVKDQEHDEKANQVSLTQERLLELMESVKSDRHEETVETHQKEPAKNYPVDKKGDPLRMTSVTWTTPLGLPVSQPYRQGKTREYTTALQAIRLYDIHAPAAVDASKQSTAFPPNFIHSLDAAHMMLTAIACKNHGLEFASVHDSFWTHACDVDTMSRLLRESFITLHKRDLMKELKEEFEFRYATHYIPVSFVLKGEDLKKWFQYLVDTGRRSPKARPTPKKEITVWIPFELLPLPEKGNLDIEVVRNSPYFFH